MRTYKIRFFISILGCVILLAALCRAQDRSYALTLDQVLGLAYERNPQMQQVRQMLKARKGKAVQSKSLPNPEGEISIGGLRKDETGKRNSEVNSFSIKQPLGTLGAQFLKWQIADREVNIEKANLELTWGQVRTHVVQLYSQILFQNKALDLSRNNLEVTRQFFTLVENRFESGDALKTELTRAKIEVLKAENDILINQKNLDVLKGELNLTLGNKLNASLELGDALDDVHFEDQYENLLQHALANRADIRIASEQLKIARRNLINSYMETVFPELSVGFERTMEDYDNNSSILLEFSYPLWGFNQGKIQETIADRERRNLELEALKQQVSLEVYAAFFEVQLAGKQVNLNKKALEEANELLRQITMSYQEGEMTFMAFLENLKTIKETRLSYLEAINNLHEKFAQLQMNVQDTPIPGGQDEQ